MSRGEVGIPNDIYTASAPAPPEQMMIMGILLVAVAPMQVQEDPPIRW